MDFESAVRFIDSLVSFEHIRDFEYSEKDFDLKRVSDFLFKADIEFEKLKYVHVAGSKGKGTVCGLCSEYLVNCGFKVGLFTSPHIHTIRERIKINGALVDEEEFGKLAGELKKLLDNSNLKLTYFEFLFVMAIKFFLEQEVDFAIIEVGLGGRLDATNVINPQVAVITRLELEHTDILGDSLEKIVVEKLGIVKKEVSVVISPQGREVLDIISNKLKGREKVFFANQNLTGDAFFENVQTMRIVMQVLTGTVDESVFKKTVNDFFMEGRFDVRKISGKEVVFDIAHTPNSVRSLLGMLEKRFKDRKLIFLLSVMKDKKVQEILDVILKKADKVILTEADVPRVFKWKENLAENKRVLIEEDVEKAFQMLKDEIKNESFLGIVTGSNFLVSKVLPQL